MNATTTPLDSGSLFGDKMSGFGYGIGVSVGILLLITTITLATYYCTRNHLYASPTTRTARRRQRRGDIEEPPPPTLDHHLEVVEVGLDEETIKSYPNLPYEEARESYSKTRKDSTAASCCSICLADYQKDDMIRVLPDCNHLFHAKCVDPWLRLHPTCPVCRTSPFPTPVPTPLAEVVPLTDRRD